MNKDNRSGIRGVFILVFPQTGYATYLGKWPMVLWQPISHFRKVAWRSSTKVGWVVQCIILGTDS